MDVYDNITQDEFNRIRHKSGNPIPTMASTPSYGLTYMSDGNEDLETFVKYPIEKGVTAFSDANWGPMDASIPKKDAPPIEQSPDSLRSLSG